MGQQEELMPLLIERDEQRAYQWTINQIEVRARGLIAQVDGLSLARFRRQ